MAKTKQQLVDEIKTATGEELDPKDYTVEQLEAKLAEASGDESEAEEVPTITVKVSADKGSGSYLHPVSKDALVRGGKAVAVPDDAWTQDMVAKRFLTEVRK